MSLSNSFISFLDRFEDQLEVDCERLKHELIAEADRQFGVMRAKVNELKNRFGNDGLESSNNGGAVIIIIARFDYVNRLADDPEVKNVSFEEWKRETAAEQQQRNEPCTSSGRKRGSHSGQPVASKKLKTSSSNTNRVKKYVCKFEGCGQSFDHDRHLFSHERIHLAIKPYSCTWANCGYSSETRPNVVRHVKHFKLSHTQKEQQRLNIIDGRDPNEYVQVDNQLVDRRLE